MWKRPVRARLFTPDYSVLGNAAHRVLASKSCPRHRKYRAGCRRCQYVVEVRRQELARELIFYWPVWEAKHQARFEASAAAALDRYWKDQARAALALEISRNRWRDN